MVTIRTATVADASAIAHVHVSSWRSTYTGLVADSYLASLDPIARTEQWQQWLTLDLPILVAEDAGSLVGFAGGGALREPLPGFDAELFAIYLLASAQHQGTGTLLLRSLAARLVTRGHTALLAWVLSVNSSRHFYGHTGAHLVSAKQIEIDGIAYPVQAFGWSSLSALATF